MKSTLIVACFLGNVQAVTNPQGGSHIPWPIYGWLSVDPIPRRRKPWDDCSHIPETRQPRDRGQHWTTWYPMQDMFPFSGNLDLRIHIWDGEVHITFSQATIQTRHLSWSRTTGMDTSDNSYIYSILRFFTNHAKRLEKKSLNPFVRCLNTEMSYHEDIGYTQWLYLACSN